MFFRILKKDLKRKKVMNVVLLCFIILATMFVASGITNVVSVVNGIDCMHSDGTVVSCR